MSYIPLAYTISLPPQYLDYLVSEGGYTARHAASAECPVWLQHEVRGGAHDYSAGQGRVLHVHGVKLPLFAKDGGADEGADGGGEQRDVGIDIRSIQVET